MKSIKGILFTLLFSSMIVSCVQGQWGTGIKGQGPKVTKTLDVSGFDGITLAFSGDVYLKQGSNYAVEAEGQENIIDNIETNVSGGIWRIKFDRNVRNHQGIKIYITMPKLTQAKIAGSGNIYSEGLFENVDHLALGVSGSGDIKMEVSANNVESRISGSGSISLAGKTVGHEIQISGSGDIHSYDLTATKCSIRVSGSGNCQVDVIEDLDVSISGSGDVTYEGRPRIKSKASGSGNVKPRG